MGKSLLILCSMSGFAVRAGSLILFNFRKFMKFLFPSKMKNLLECQEVLMLRDFPTT